MLTHDHSFDLEALSAREPSFFRPLFDAGRALRVSRTMVRDGGDALRLRHGCIVFNRMLACAHRGVRSLHTNQDIAGDIKTTLRPNAAVTTQPQLSVQSVTILKA